MKKIIFLVILTINTAIVFGQNNLFSTSNYNSNWLYVGGRICGALHFYQFFDSDIDNKLSLDFAFQMTISIVDNFGIQTELLYTSEEVKYTANGNITIGGYTHPAVIDFKQTVHNFIIPILARATYDIGIFNIAGIFGPYFTIPIGKLDHESEVKYLGTSSTYSNSQDIKMSFGLMVGINFGVRIGPGILFADIRYGIDNNAIETTIQGKSNPGWHRKILPFSIGYQIGLLKK